MFANSSASLLTNLKNESSELYLQSVKVLFYTEWYPPLTRTWHLYLEGAKGQAAEHMEPFMKCQRVFGGGCGNVLSVGCLKSSIHACPFCTEGSREMPVDVMCSDGKRSLLPLLVIYFLWQDLQSTYVNTPSITFQGRYLRRYSQTSI